ncbi:MAG TPA: dihydrolipoamide acetyltransferase family protein [Acidimicrobiales bacterium]|nr:dihydrolipoamide acetyltransferase family protein [Acidimicrobiales bacterium]
MADITMPQLGETVTEGTITRWFKEVGDQVAVDETLFEVSTDKVDSEVPSPVAGYVTEIVVPPGGTVAVGATLAVVSDEAPGGAGGSGARTAPGAEDASTPEGSGAEEPPAGQGGEAPAPQGGDRPPADGTGAPAPEPGPAEPSGDDPPPGEHDDRGPSRLVSPIVRRLAAEHGLDLASLAGSGAGGRITRQDVQAAISSGDGRPATPSRASAAPGRQAPAPAPARPAAALVAAGEGDEVVPFSNIRRRTAEHMIRSKATSAHTLVVSEVDYDAVDRVRTAVRAGFKAEEGISLTYLPFVSRAVVDALREFPRMNASVGEDHLVLHRAVHLGIAVDLHFEGLMVPVIHGAGEKRLRALARDIAELAARARSRQLGPDDIAGGTFTITNPGPFATLLTGAIINQPQVAILSTDGVKKRPVAVTLPDGSDAIAVHPVGNLALTFDHRAVDGAYAAAFLAQVKEIIEGRDWSAELA